MMRRGTWSILVATIIGLCVCTPGSYAEPSQCELEDLRTLQEVFADLAASVRPSVVALRTYRSVPGLVRSEADVPVRVADNQGSGFIIRSDGYILTNQHVIAEADKIDVIVDGGDFYNGTLIQADPRSDLAVIKIDARGLTAAKLGELSDVRQGHWTFAMGNPFGLANDDGSLAFSVGNVTAIGKSLTPELDPTETRYYGNLIQTSSAINPGNSGGPLFNIDGEVIGVCTAMLSSSGVNEGTGFAIPIDKRARRIIAILESGEQVRYGFLGVKVATPTRDQRQDTGMRGQGGALVREIIEASGPAGRAGLEPGDIILTFDGEPIDSSDHLVRLVGATPVGATVEVVYVRDHGKKRANVCLTERPVFVAYRTGQTEGSEPRTLRWAGTILAEQPDKILSAAGLTRSEAGLVIVDVDARSRAYKAGLRNGAIIMRYDGRRVQTLGEFRALDSKATGRVRLGLLGGKTITFKR